MKKVGSNYEWVRREEDPKTLESCDIQVWFGRARDGVVY
jgi:hypothetical protein